MNMKLAELRIGGVLLLTALAAMAAMSGSAAAAEKNSQPSEEQLQQKLDAAQKRLDQAAREVAELSMSLSEHVVPPGMPLVAKMSQRAMLGVNIGSRRGSERDDGVEVVSVSPGGAAADAGLKAGDVLVEVNGKSLQRDGSDSPRAKLMEAIREVEAGEKIAVSYRRDGKLASTSVVAQPVADRMFTMALPTHGGPGGFGPMAHFAFRRAEGVFGSAELVSLTPKLGQYFGTEKGLLVVRAPEDSRLKLEDGDVIVDIDGRVPSSPSHALRILGSYQEGEKLELTVLRMKKRVSFDITVPEGGGWEKRLQERSRLMHEMIMPAPVPGTAVPMPPPPPPGVGAVSIAAPLPEGPI